MILWCMLYKSLYSLKYSKSLHLPNDAHRLDTLSQLHNEPTEPSQDITWSSIQYLLHWPFSAFSYSLHSTVASHGVATNNIVED